MSTATASTPPVKPRWRTIAELLHQLGDIPPDRIRFDPFPGTATMDDAIRVKRSEAPCELVNGTLVEIAMSSPADCLGFYLAFLFQSFIGPDNDDFVITPRAQFEMIGGNLREPDASFTRKERVIVPISKNFHPWCPDICVEVLSPSNTLAEMAIKRADYFSSGCQLVWIIDPESRKVRVFTDENTFVELDESGVLDGGIILPGFTVPLSALFARLNRYEP